MAFRRNAIFYYFWVFIMKFYSILLLFIFCSLSAQKITSADSLKLAEAADFFADDYGSLYLYRQKDFSLTKLDSLGKQTGRQMMTVPFRVQSVQNPLNIFLFSENAQELKLLDANLNEIQKIDFRQKFGFIKAAYAEDLQQIWLLDESSKRLLQYNYRQDHVLNSYPFGFDFERLITILVYSGKLYVLNENSFEVYDFNGNKLETYPVENSRKMYRQNDSVFVLEKNKIFRYDFPNSFVNVFTARNFGNVDKNTHSFFELSAGKLYLYEPE